MINKKIIVWPDLEYNKWYFYDIVTSKKYSLKIKGVDILEQKKFFWSISASKDHILSRDMFYEIFLDLKKMGFLDCDINYKKYKIPFNIDFKKNNIKNFIIEYDKKIDEKFITVLNKYFDRYVDKKHTIKFFLSPIFNPKKLDYIINKNKSVVPIFISESDLIIGPKINNKVCPCPKCLNIRLGGSSSNYLDFERQIELDNRYDDFLRKNYFDTEYSNIDEIIFIAIDRYVNYYTRGIRNIFVRYSFKEEKFYENIFLPVLHNRK